MEGGFVAFFWTISGPFLGPFRAISGPFLGYFWAISGPFPGHFWTIYENVYNYNTGSGPAIGRKCPGNKSEYMQIPYIYPYGKYMSVPEMAQKWPGNGPNR